MTKPKQTHRHRKQTSVNKDERDGVGKRDKLGVWVNIYTTIYKRDNQDRPTRE